MKTITFQTKAWLSDGKIERNADSTDVDNMSFYKDDMTDFGWVEVGTAEITVTLVDRKTVVVNQIAGLNEAKRRIQAEAEKRLTEIEGQIQSLQALPAEVCRG